MAEAEHSLQAMSSHRRAVTAICLIPAVSVSVLAAANPRFGSYDDLAGSADQACVLQSSFGRKGCYGSFGPDGLRNHNLDAV